MITSKKWSKGTAVNGRLKTDSLAWRNTRQLLVLAIPGILWFVIFAYIPMFGSIIAFKDFDYAKGIWLSDWNGLENFKYLFSTDDAMRIFRNTVLYNAVFIIFGTAISVMTAVFLDFTKRRVFIKIYQTALFLPHLISWVVVAYIALAMFSFTNGFFNHLLGSIGKEPVSWYMEPKYWPIILIAFNVWKTIGFNVLVYYGSIMGIDSSLYEAAAIDGASKTQMIFKITMPLLKPTIILMFIMSIGNMMRADFGLFYYVPNDQGALYAVTDVIDTYIYRALKTLGDVAGSSAASVFQSVVGLGLVLLSNYVVKKIDADSAMF